MSFGEASTATFADDRELFDRRHGSLIAANSQAAQGDEVQPARVKAVLPQLEQAGWNIRAAVERIWAGVRDWHTLVDELDSQEALLILRVLETLDSASSMPPTNEET